MADSSRDVVLVVDDNIDAADMTAALLNMFGAEVIVAYDGYEAIRLARQHRPSVIFLDIGMPVISGCEVAKMLRGDHSFDGVKLVALTAWGDPDTKAATHEAGFDLHLTKPAKIDHLLEALQSRP